MAKGYDGCTMHLLWLWQRAHLLLAFAVPANSLSVAAPTPPPAPPPSLSFSAGFSSDMVLQQTMSTGVKVYGLVYFEGASVEVEVGGAASYTIPATVTPSTKESNATWTATLRPTKGSTAMEYTIQARCVTGCEQAPNASLNKVTLSRVVFGDVYFCAGQSNMALPLKYSFSAKKLQQQVLNGMYTNIRTFQYGGMSVSEEFHSDSPRFITSTGAVDWYNLSYAAALPEPKVPNKHIVGPFQAFSATCTYYGVGLTDELGSDAPPIGLIQSAVGGTQIEAWIDNTTLTKCMNESTSVINPSPPSKLFYGMVTPFLNMAVAGWVWYQGENNCHGDMGNSVNGTGYGCDQAALVQLWRDQWSSWSATNPLAPFGLVTLAAGGSEGAKDHMAGMRWSQTANYGSLPNQAMPNTFLAQGYDIGDPWAKSEGKSNNKNCSDPGPNRSPDPQCVPFDATTWAPKVKEIAPLIKNSSQTPTFMGGIHPRFKHEVGRRLAVAHVQKLAGPTIASCTAESQTIVVELDAAKMGGEDVLVQPFNNNVSSWAQPDASTLMVCTGAQGPAIANTTSCGCSSWAYIRYPSPNDPDHTGNDKTAWYCEVGPSDAWKPTAEMLVQSKARHALEVEQRFRKGSDVPVELGWVPKRNPYLTIWTPPTLRAGKPAANGNPTIVADLQGINGSTSVMAVRYGWPFSGDTCCPSELVQKGFEVCQPAACPVLSASTNLPLNPFFALLKDGKCECLAPQQC